MKVIKGGGFSFKEEIEKVKKNRIKVIPPKIRIDPNDDIIYHPSPRGFNSSYIQLFGRPKKLATWGFREEENNKVLTSKIRRVTIIRRG